SQNAHATHKSDARAPSVGRHKAAAGRKTAI
ncbi:hypothetical protein EVAR_72133_1, partial [Eumeta japonica]